MSLLTIKERKNRVVRQKRSFLLGKTAIKFPKKKTSRGEFSLKDWGAATSRNQIIDSKSRAVSRRKKRHKVKGGGGGVSKSRSRQGDGRRPTCIRKKRGRNSILRRRHRRGQKKQKGTDGDVDVGAGKATAKDYVAQTRRHLSRKRQKRRGNAWRFRLDKSYAQGKKRGARKSPLLLKEGRISPQCKGLEVRRNQGGDEPHDHRAEGGGPST